VLTWRKNRKKIQYQSSVSEFQGCRHEKAHNKVCAMYRAYWRGISAVATSFALGVGGAGFMII